MRVVEDFADAEATCRCGSDSVSPVSVFGRVGARAESPLEPSEVGFSLVHRPAFFHVAKHELSQMLVYLKSPTVIEKTVKLLEAPSKPTPLSWQTLPASVVLR